MNYSPLTFISSSEIANKTKTNQSENILQDSLILKLSIRPVKNYKLISCDKNMIHDYNYLISKIKSNSSASIGQFPLTLFLKKGTNEEITINDETDWNECFNNQSVFEMIDSKNTLKVEFVLRKHKKKNAGINEEGIKAALLAKNGNENLKQIMDTIIANEVIRNTLKEEIFRQIIRTENSNSAGDEKLVTALVSSKPLDEFYTNFLGGLLETTLEKLTSADEMKKVLQAELNSINENSDDENGNIQLSIVDEDFAAQNIPSFSEFYKNEQIEIYRSKLMSENFSKKY